MTDTVVIAALAVATTAITTLGGVLIARMNRSEKKIEKVTDIVVATQDAQAVKINEVKATVDSVRETVEIAQVVQTAKLDDVQKVTSQTRGYVDGAMEGLLRTIAVAQRTIANGREDATLEGIAVAAEQALADHVARRRVQEAEQSAKRKLDMEDDERKKDSSR